jgi:hypothetical protein
MPTYAGGRAWDCIGKFFGVVLEKREEARTLSSQKLKYT